MVQLKENKTHEPSQNARQLRDNQVDVTQEVYDPFWVRTL